MNRSTAGSNFTALLSECEVGSASWIEACWNDMRDRAKAGESYDAEQYISMIPGASTHQIADLVYGEFVTSRESGKYVLVEHYLSKYPNISEQLARQFTIDEALSLMDDEESCRLQAASEETVVATARDLSDSVESTGESKVGRYMIVDKLKRGAQADVYRAYDPILKRDVVIKIEPAGKPTNPSPFSDVEAVITANLNHPNIAPALDAGEHRGRKYSVSRFIHGRTFDQWVRDLNPSPQQVAQVMARIARGLAHAHNNAVLHLDVKPRNILVDENQEPYLIDFGLSVTCDAFAEHALEEGVVRGTLRFMAPEQINGDVERMGPCSDIFGLGATLFAGWVGRAPYDAPRDRNDLKSIQRCHWHVEWLDEAGLSDEMKSIVVRALAASPEQRHATCDQFASELERVSQVDDDQEVDNLDPLTSSNHSRSSKKRTFWSRTLPGAAALVLVFGLAIGLRTVATRDGGSVSPVSLASIEVAVVTDDDRLVDLASRVPLVSGDKLRLTGWIPANQFALVVAFSKGGNGRVIARFEKQDQPRRYRHPDNPGKALPLVGPGGTEVVALLTADSREALNRVMTQLEQHSTPWDLIPEQTVLTWHDDQFIYLQHIPAEVDSLQERLGGGSRSLGDAVDINPAVTKLSDQFVKLAARLHREGVEMDAVAFRHLSRESGD